MGCCRKGASAIPLLLVAYVYAVSATLGAQPETCSGDTRASAQLSIDQGHAWRPPFGLDRIGSQLIVRVKLMADEEPFGTYHVMAYSGQKVERHELDLKRNPNTYWLGRGADPSLFFARAPLTSVPSQVALQVQCGERTVELAREIVAWPEIEADAIARPNRAIHPVDLGTVLVPHDWLLLARGQTAVVNVAAFSRGHDLPNARLRAWFDGARPLELAWPLARNEKAERQVELQSSAGQGDSTVLHIGITDGRRELWRKDIRTMIVTKSPSWPAFGAVETKLRYDAPIFTVNPRTGERLPDTRYDTAWDAKLKDVVVLLPNGSRFVFWRGANYIPFWATRHNTGILYQWAENCTKAMRVTQPDGTWDCPEPLFDAELRFGRVRIVESSEARVHVRWDYQLTDVRYEVLGGAAGEDFYFYPDGFGTRVVTVPSMPGEMYQLSEFIIITPQAAYPLEVLPKHLVEALGLDGAKERIEFPVRKGRIGKILPNLVERREGPMIYRVFAHKNDVAGAIYFHPSSPAVPWVFLPFYDQGELVTPVYWGNHWPLNRGKWTGWEINDRVSITPAHNSVAAFSSPRDPETGEFEEGFEVEPLVRGKRLQPDASGQVRTVDLSRFVWMIAYSDLPDDELRNWGRSFSLPPALEVHGGRLDLPSYSPERRALRIVAEASSMEIKLKPAEYTVNPVFEIDQAPRHLARVSLGGKALRAHEYAWDGSVLWVNGIVGAQGETIGLEFQ